MRILNYGSLNFDKVYEMPHFVAEGESLLSLGYEEFLGGKGLNQSLALARAGATVYQAGAVGPDGGPLRAILEENGVDTRYLQTVATVSGHAIIQKQLGKNCIIVYGGANQETTAQELDAILAAFGPGDMLLLQNETSNVPYAIGKAKERGMKVALNASPITPELLSYPLELVDIFLINEVEGKALACTDREDYSEILNALCRKYPQAAIVLTVGENGVLYSDGALTTGHRRYTVPVADTTAAGDTFCGYFLAGLAKGLTVEECLRQASMAAAIAVSRHGAAPSIPRAQEVQAFAASLQC